MAVNKEHEKAITEPFYSNSFFEVIKAKIKNPSIKIIPIRPKYNIDFCYRFFWIDGNYDYSFIKSDILLHWYDIPWHKGRIIQHKKNYAKEYIAYKKHLEIKRKIKLKEAIAYFERQKTLTQNKKLNKQETKAKEDLHKEAKLSQFKFQNETRFGENIYT